MAPAFAHLAAPAVGLREKAEQGCIGAWLGLARDQAGLDATALAGEVGGEAHEVRSEIADWDAEGRSEGLG